MAIRKFKVPCFWVECDWCGLDCFRESFDFQPHYNTVSDAKEAIIDDDVITFKGKHYCCEDCRNAAASPPVERVAASGATLVAGCRGADGKPKRSRKRPVTLKRDVIE